MDGGPPAAQRAAGLPHLGAAQRAAAGRDELSRRLLRWAAAAAILVALLLLGRQGAGLIPAAALRLEALGGWAFAAFVGIYALATVALVPGSLLTLAAGALFGVALGTAAAFSGALAGSTLAFLVARHLARPAVERRLARDPRVQRIDRAIGARGARLVLLLRLSPLLPFSVMNYALGVTRVRLRDYTLGAVGMLPGTLLYVWTGKLAGDVAAAASGAAAPRGAASWALLALGLAATAAVTVTVARMARAALDEAADVEPSA